MRVLCFIVLAVLWSTPAISASSQYTECLLAFNERAGVGDKAGAIEPGECALQEGINDSSVDQDQLASLAEQLGLAYGTVRKKEKEIRSIQMAVDIYDRAHGELSKQSYQARRNLAYAHLINSDDKAAARIHSDLVRLKNTHFKNDKVVQGQLDLLRGRIDESRLFLKAAMTKYKSAIKAFDAAGDQSPDNIGLAYFMTGRLYMARKKDKLAIEYFDYALEIYELSYPPGHHEILRTHTFLIQAYSRKKDPDGATPHVLHVARYQDDLEREDPKPLFRRAPTYPLKASDNGFQGWVQIEFTIDKEGFVKDPVVIDAERPKLFNKPALKALEKWRYAPKVENGERVESREVVVITFVLRP